MLDSHVAQQAQQLHRTITQANLTAYQLWWRYFDQGGCVGQFEVHAYLNQAIHLPRLDRQLLDRAARELIAG